MPGGHSTATRRVEGKVAAAERGTLFLDEVAEMTPAAQAKLLQLLQEREYFPLGASHPVRANVRVIAATNTDLDAALAERRFREDLFYRLHVLPLRVPTLAERRGDILPLATHFCEHACTSHGLTRVGLSPAAADAIENAEWPGNVRQLAHAVEAAAIRASGEGARWVERRHVFPDADATDETAPSRATMQEAMRRFQRRLLVDTLHDCNWNIVEASRRLDTARSHTYGLMRALGITRPS
jgi:Nif-specific regulatory protein